MHLKLTLRMTGVAFFYGEKDFGPSAQISFLLANHLNSAQRKHFLADFDPRHLTHYHPCSQVSAHPGMKNQLNPPLLVFDQNRSHELLPLLGRLVQFLPLDQTRQFVILGHHAPLALCSS